MVKYNLIVADPPWEFSDRLTMSSTPRGADANYDTLTLKAIEDLEISELAADDAVLVLWVPSSMLQEGLSTMKNWGFVQKQTFVWVKVKQTHGALDPLKELRKQCNKLIKNPLNIKTIFNDVNNLINGFDINNILSMYLGHLFRQTHEIALIGIRGNIYNKLAVKNQRSVLLDKNFGHSSKPEGLQDRLNLMFPDFIKLELFARRQRLGWLCVGDEAFMTKGEDVRTSIKKLKNITSSAYEKMLSLISDDSDMSKNMLSQLWKSIDC
ncbi:MAG: MT-A70 family methyltransferase [bacterium]|nr:MT-A70 family methyltransferase [bacterium]